MTTQTQQTGFDPARYLTTLSRRQRTPEGGWTNVALAYLEVKFRLLWLRTEHPEARIETQLARLEPNFAVFSAKVTLPSGAEATGWGSETADDWKDYIEKAETKALGRALAAVGFGTQYCADFEEGTPDHVVDAPVARGRQASGDSQTPPSGAAQPVRQQAPQSAPPTATRGGGPPPPAAGGNDGGWRDRPATEPQIKAIYAIARGQQAMDDGTLEEYCRNRYGRVPAELTRRQASELIDSLKLGAAS